MSKPPAGLPETGALALEIELLGEAAAALGRAGRRVEQTLRALGEADPATRVDRLFDAAEAVRDYFVVREAAGFLGHDDAIALLRIPASVLARLGASRASGHSPA